MKKTFTQADSMHNSWTGDIVQKIVPAPEQVSNVVHGSFATGLLEMKRDETVIYRPLISGALPIPSQRYARVSCRPFSVKEEDSEDFTGRKTQNIRNTTLQNHHHLCFASVNKAA